MIPFEKFELSNGLRVIHQFDANSTLACLNVLYDVGARHEDENRTGFAHLFEHLMFGGSKNIPEFDVVIQEAGGNNNAFTTNDITNYYDVLPCENIETAFWAESDRMLELAFTPQSLEVQRNVVIEEYKQRYLNQPYGDVWLLLHPLLYEKHPYRWPTIGKEIDHIRNATLDDVKHFFYNHYAPNNAILCVSGNVTLKQFHQLCKKWFEPLPMRDIAKATYPKEPEQTQKKFLKVQRNVPASRIYKVWKMPGLDYPNYRVFNLLTQYLSGGKSSRLTRELVHEKKIFTQISAYVYGLYDDPGIFIISGTLSENQNPESAEHAVNTLLEQWLHEGISEKDFQKSKNKMLTQLAFANYNVESRAENLCFYEWLGILDEFNHENELYENISPDMMMNEARKLFREEKSGVLYYLSDLKK